MKAEPVEKPAAVHDLHANEVELRSEFSPLTLKIHLATGLPTSIHSARAGIIVPLTATIEALLGGIDRRGPVGNLIYNGEVLDAAVTTTGPIRSRLLRNGREFVVPTAIGGWNLDIIYTFRAAEPSLTWAWRLKPAANADPMRDLIVTLDLQLDDPARWTVNAPGNQVRPDLGLVHLPVDGIPIQSIGGVAASSGIVGFSTSSLTAIVWPRSKDELSVSRLSRTEAGSRVRYSTRAAAAASPSTELLIEGIALDIVDAPWGAVRGRVRDWMSDLTITTPGDRPDWTRGATIYEVQIGESLFEGGAWTYSPYPTMGELLADLPRIKALGFDTIQLMPQQPFPSYNVIDYDDIDVTYGDERLLRRVITWCHENGMKVILDILLHGVIDKESITEIADAVRLGPWAELAKADFDTVLSRNLTTEEQALLSWSRHILDFEAAWRDGSPTRHPLTEEHPEWFCTDSRGAIIGVYTKAFDMSNPGWHEYFTSAVERLVIRLDIDGFRFDAPSYNDFPNWSPRTQTRASLQPLGAIELFKTLRKRLHSLRPDLLMYTEPNGALWRQSMDLNYNYDETWLPGSLFGNGGDHPDSRVRNGRDLASWLNERDQSLPTGSLTAHHIDSHDTFWWPLPSAKWRREQFGTAATRALMSAFALAGGPYMMFVGGEVEIEDDVKKVNSLRAVRAELAMGTPTFGVPAVTNESVFSASHHCDDARSILLVNLSSETVSADVQLEAGAPTAWSDLLDDGQPVDLSPGSTVVWGPMQARFLVPTIEGGPQT